MAGNLGIEFIVLPLIFAFVMLVIVLFAVDRWRREQHRVELQKAILERVGSVKDLGEFLTTQQGQRFLANLAPRQFRPHLRGLSSISIGIVLLIVGLFLMVALHTKFLGAPGGRSTPPALLVGILLLIALGIGMLVSATVSLMIARRLGLDNGSRNDARKGDAA